MPAKRNAFSMFMEERRPEMIKSGRSTGARNEIALILSEEWKNLPDATKEKYKRQADDFNANRPKPSKPELEYSEHYNEIASPLLGPTGQPGKYTKAMRDMMMEKACEDSREYVLQMFESDDFDWMDQPIVACSVSLYADPEFNDIFMPAEIGLCAFSLRKGVMDNFGRLIDIGEVPLGFMAEVWNNCERMAIPYPGECPEFTNLEPIILTLLTFMEKYRGYFNKGEYCVFCLDSEFANVTRSLEYIMEVTGRSLNIRVLSLSYYAYKAANRKVLKFAARDISSEILTGGPRASSEGSAKLAEKDETGLVLTTKINSHRTFRVPLNPTFMYNPFFSMTQFGSFFREKDVDECILGSDSYKWNDELGCVYHFKKSNGIQYCALNMVNRIVFHMLEILTLSNEVKVVPGAHYPELENRDAEVNRRHGMLMRWGITKYETEMEDITKKVWPEEERPRYQKRENCKERNSFKRREPDGPQSTTFPRPRHQNNRRRNHSDDPDTTVAEAFASISVEEDGQIPPKSKQSYHVKFRQQQFRNGNGYHIREDDFGEKGGVNGE